VHPPTSGVLTHRVDNTLRNRHFVHGLPRFGRDDPTIGRASRIPRAFGVSA
jgi:hypothetical protein